MPAATSTSRRYEGPGGRKGAGRGVSEGAGDGLGGLERLGGTGGISQAHPTPLPQSFTRLTELVLQAHRKELDELRGLPRAPTLARLEEDEQQPLGSEDTPKTCWC